MIVLRGEHYGMPLVVEVGYPSAAVVVTDASEHHLTVRLDDGCDQAHLVLARDVAVRLVAHLQPHMDNDQLTWFQHHDKP